MTTVIAAAAQAIGRGREIADREAGHTDPVVVIPTLIENLSRTEQNALLDAFMRHGFPKDSS